MTPIATSKTNIPKEYEHVYNEYAPMRNDVLEFLIEGHPPFEQLGIKREVALRESERCNDYVIYCDKWMYHVKHGQILESQRRVPMSVIETADSGCVKVFSYDETPITVDSMTYEEWIESVESGSKV